MYLKSFAEEVLIKDWLGPQGGSFHHHDVLYIFLFVNLILWSRLGLNFWFLPGILVTIFLRKLDQVQNPGVVHA